MEYDISFGLSRKDTNVKTFKWTWEKLVERLKDVAYCGHTMEAYKKMTKQQRVDAKDVGFFIGGSCRKRKVVHRQIISLDIDETDNKTLTNLHKWLKGYAYVIHSTHSSTPDSPRYRVVVPLDRPVFADEYSAIMRILSEQINIPVDVATLDFNRVMFLPSVPKDAEYFFESSRSKKSMQVAEILALQPDWKDLSGTDVPQKVSVQDPKYKGGIIGAFCAKYTIREAIDAFLTEVWKKEPTGRYTFIGASTTNGGIIYEDKFLFSNHSTDPYMGHCYNAYDAVRLYKFGEGKKGIEEMRVFCESLGIRVDSGSQHAITIEEMDDEEAKNILMERLEIDKNGVLCNTLANALLILQNDPKLKGVFGYDLFAECPVLKRTPFWRQKDVHEENEDCTNIKSYDEMTDTDESYLRFYLENAYRFNSRNVLDDALKIIEHENSFHPVRDYLTSLEWDGVSRLERIFIDCFGVPDTIYSREVGLKFFVGAVRRVFIPASKMDYIPVLVSEEGLGKSKFVRRMAKIWGSDTFYTFNGSKEAYEQLRGVWIMEIPELNGVQSKSTNSRKAFVTKGEDRYRSAYLKYTKTYKRQCVFMASSNDVIFLDDPSEDGRRWWGLMCNKRNITISVHEKKFLDLVDLYWAEAVHYFKQGVLPVLSEEAEAEAKKVRNVHRSENVEEGALIDYLLMPVPDNWYEKSTMERINYYEHERAIWVGKPRTEICGVEVAREFYRYERKDITPAISRKVADAIRHTGLFDLTSRKSRFGDYGRALAWVRNSNVIEE